MCFEFRVYSWLLEYSGITFTLKASKQNCSFWRRGKHFGGGTAVKLNVGGDVPILIEKWQRASNLNPQEVTFPAEGER